MKKIEEALSFDDVLIKPTYSEIESRLDVDISATIAGSIHLKTPIISSPMDTVTEDTMVLALGKLGTTGILHRFCSDERRLQMLRVIQRVKYTKERLSEDIYIIPSFGISETEMNFMDRVIEIYGDDIDAVCLDVANGYTKIMKDAIAKIRKKYTFKIIAGNVATAEGYQFLYDHGADAVRVGIGSGSICSTRIQTGVSTPLLHSLFEISEKTDHRISVLADGGIKYPGDLTKAIAAGADAIISGSIFAGADETPGELVNNGSGNFKKYRGMASYEAQREYRGGLKEGTCAEGVSTLLLPKGPVSKILDNFSGGLRSGMTYVNARNLKELRENAEFIKMTEAGLSESHAYGTRK